MVGPLPPHRPQAIQPLPPRADQAADNGPAREKAWSGLS